MRGVIVGGVRGVITRGLRQDVLGVGNMGIPGCLGSFRSKMVFFWELSGCRYPGNGVCNFLLAIKLVR